MKKRHGRLDYSKPDDLLLALAYEECNSECEQPCKITRRLREAAYETIEILLAEGARLECKRRALWDALVSAYRREGSGLGEAQILADAVMDTASDRRKCPECGFVNCQREPVTDHDGLTADAE